MIQFKRVEKKDLELLREWRNEDKIRKWCRQVGYISELDQDRWYHKQNDDPTLQMFVILREWGDMGIQRIGVCGLTDIDLVNRRAEFSLYIGPEYQQKGYARRALASLFNYGFNELGLNLIWGESFEGNPARSMFKKLGMTEEGCRRQFYFKDGQYIGAYLYSITAKEWVDA